MSKQHLHNNNEAKNTFILRVEDSYCKAVTGVLGLKGHLFHHAQLKKETCVSLHICCLVNDESSVDYEGFELALHTVSQKKKHGLH